MIWNHTEPLDPQEFHFFETEILKVVLGQPSVLHIYDERVCSGVYSVKITTHIISHVVNASSAMAIYCVVLNMDWVAVLVGEFMGVTIEVVM